MMLRRKRDQVILLGVALFLLLLLYSILREDHDDDQPSSIQAGQKAAKATAAAAATTAQPMARNTCPKDSLRDVTCQVNKEVSANLGLRLDEQPDKGRSLRPFITNVQCKLNPTNNEVYVPFSHIKSYFEVSGDLKDGGGKFVWSHSYARVFQHLKDTSYDPHGAFLQFANLNVENRPRVKCVNAKDGVPISSQWDKNGYFYSTQISQYALAQWSKYTAKRANLNEDKRQLDLVLEDGTEGKMADWISGNDDDDVMRVTSENNCVHFDRKTILEINKNVSDSLLLGFDLRFEDNVTISVGVRISGKRFFVKYVPQDDLFLAKQGNTVVFGYGTVRVPTKGSTSSEDGNSNYENKWKTFTRNVANDLMKGLGRKIFDKMFLTSKKVMLERLTFEGVGCVTNVTLLKSSEANRRLFFHAADWLVRSQDAATGGWPVQVTFNDKKAGKAAYVKYLRAKEIPAGWNSAMAQGHAMSVLSRAYHATKKGQYLEAAAKALALFHHPTFSDDDQQPLGVSSKFMGQHVWYEEYPTEPSTFILNGFMYSLLGLYDFWQTTRDLEGGLDLGGHSREARKLFEAGMRSLKTLLPFYDTGSGSVYDLRHFTMPGVEPKIARWDYHALHVNLLFVLSTIDASDDGVGSGSDFLLSTAKRWEGYMYGKRAEHN